jgi:hypothetical protein
MQQISKFLKKNKENILRIFPVLLIAIALPLVVLLSLQQQNIREKAATALCNNGLICQSCTPKTNSCNYGNGTQSCSYTQSLDGSACTAVAFPNVLCYKPNCSAGSTCSTSQQCIAQATPTPTPIPNSQKIVQFGPSGTQAQFLALMKDMSVDVIEMQAGTYSGWNLVMNIDRISSPLIIRPASGATVIFDGTGDGSKDGPFYFGDSYVGGNYYASNITFDGSNGIFRIQNYTIGATGLVWMQYVHNITMNNFQVRNITGEAGGMTSHVIYVSTDGIHAPTNLTFNNWGVQLTGQLVSALQIYHTPAPAQGVTALNWAVSGCHWGFVGRYAATNVDIEGWTISNCAISFDSQGPAGTVKNMHATTSGNPTIQLPMIDGGGNVWH